MSCRARSRAAGVLAAVVLGCLLASPAPAAATGAPAPPAAPPAPLSGLALGPDRLPRCTAVVAALPERARLAQRLMVGVDGSDPLGTAETGPRPPRSAGSSSAATPPTCCATSRCARCTRWPGCRWRWPSTTRAAGCSASTTLDGELPSARAMSGLDPLRVRELGRDRARELAGYGITDQLRADRGRRPAARRRGDRRPVLRQRPGAGRPLRRRVRPGPARGRHVHRAQALPGARARRRRLAPRPGQHAAAGPAAPRRPAPYAELVGPGGPLRPGPAAAPG